MVERCAWRSLITMHYFTHIYSASLFLGARDLSEEPEHMHAIWFLPPKLKGRERVTVSMYNKWIYWIGLAFWRDGKNTFFLLFFFSLCTQKLSKCVSIIAVAQWHTDLQAQRRTLSALINTHTHKHTDTARDRRRGRERERVWKDERQIRAIDLCTRGIS